ncbi:P-loop containing nucleoside triphosphate hydrolase protein [Rickenella mellea]|uniref:uridine/cytidine kinase n=1 Tax=Rickenella mellea TaxID=50990 RepID=A0A4Y7QE71_9AGAM|nr:P-loop containing nucleoside triphosphate hydrolase protein [Rickenella mellea]
MMHGEGAHTSNQEGRYGEDGERLTDAFVIGIAGGSASGKTHVAQQIDSFYKWHTPEEVALAFENNYDLDHPDSIDMPMFAACLADLKACKQTNIPVYSFKDHQRLKETKYLYGAAIIIAEGIMTLHDPSLRALYDLKVFVQCDSDLMLARRIRRDVKERGRSVDGILEQYLRFVKPSYDHFVLPTSRYADVIVPGSDNSVAIELISTHIRRQLNDRSMRFRERMANTTTDSFLFHVPNSETPSEKMLRLNLRLLDQTPQLKGIYTILRDKTTTREDFIFFVDRLATLLVERALESLPFRPKTVVTPVGVESNGKEVDAKFICGISILRSGGPLEQGLKRVINDVPIGSLLIQSDAESGEPLLLHGMLPACIRLRHQAEEAYVFVLDAQIGTGAAAFMAIRVLLDHGVRQDRIIFVTFLVAAGGGVSVLRNAFARVKIVCGAADGALHESWCEDSHLGEGKGETDGRKVWVIEPGMGQIGDRYYL